MKRIFIIVTSLILWSITMEAQTSNVNVSPRSFKLNTETPTVSQFSRYDELPVSEYTGIPDISIPIYTIDFDGLKIPITLSYHAGGIKVNQNASWVGLGWDLSLYSVIQTVNDIDDFSTTNQKALPDWSPTSSGSIYAYPYYPQPDWAHLAFNCVNYRFPGANDPQPQAQPVDEKHYYWISADRIFSINRVWNRHERLFNDEALNGYDTEPDIFKIRLPEGTLNVIMNFQNGGFVVLNKRGYGVSCVGDKWEVVNPDGFRFFFSEKTEANTTAYLSTGGPIVRGITRTWMITKIVSPKKKAVSFNYSKEPQLFNDTIVTQYQDIYNRRDWVLNSSGSLGIINSPVPSKDIIPTNRTYNKEQQFYLQSITFPLGSVQFSTSNREDLNAVRKLDKIEIKNFNFPIRTVEFKYTYWYDSNGKSKRLGLSSVTENKEKVYTFTYNSTSLPPKNSFAQDYWGYANGYSANNSLVPNPARLNPAYIIHDNKNNHSANLPYTKARILEEINYPTGGRASFEYELNQFNNCWIPDKDSLNNIISKGYGLRVKSICYKDHGGDIKKDIYKYEGGKATLPVSLIEKFSRNELGAIYSSDAKFDYFSTEMLSLNANGFNGSNPLSSFNGVGYDRVVKCNIDKDGNENGRIETIYYNNPDIVPRQPSNGINIVSFVSVPAFKNSKFSANGSVKSQRIYDDDNKLKQETLFEYQNIKSGLYYGARTAGYATWFGMSPSYGRCDVELNIVGLYPIFDFESLPTKKIKKEYTLSDSLVSTETYSYKTNCLLSSIVRNTSVGAGYNDYTYYYYPQDYNTSGSVYQKMYNSNILTPIIKEIRYKYDGGSIVQKMTNYTDDANITKGLILPASETTSFYAGKGERTDVIYNKYDRYGNVLEYTTVDGIPTAIIWSYMYSYPIAVIKNSTYANAAQALKGEGYFDMIGAQTEPRSASYWTEISNLRNHDLLKDAQITMYSYKPLVGIQTATDPSGITTYYDYDSFGRLKETYIYKDNIVSATNKQVIQQYNYNYKTQ